MALKSLLIFITCSLFIYPQHYPDKKVHQLLVSGLHNLLQQNYESANNIFNKLIEQYPELPLGDIYLAATEIAKSFDYATEPEFLKIDAYLSKAISKSEKLLKQRPESIWNMYFMGLSRGYSAYYLAMQEKWLSAFSEGAASLEEFEKCLYVDSSFYDGFAAIGTYQYWKSSKLQSLIWLPFIEDEREEGILNLKVALSKSVYNRSLAANSLVWIYIDKGEYKSAIDICETILQDYPQNRTFKLALARALQDNEPDKAIRIYREILKSFTEPSVINEIILKHKIAQLYVILGNNSAALKLCSEIMSKIISDPYELELLEERLQRVKKLYYELKL